MSTSSIYSPIPNNILFDLGGYTGFKTKEWERYLNEQIRQHYPEYSARGKLAGQDQRWQQNDCIYESLTKYLLFEFGILLPEDTIFKVFNPNGEGLLPTDILTAISAVIEPLGLVIDHVLASDPRLRAAMGYPDRMVAMDEAILFDNRAGICMIHIEGGYSHAFFWDRMRAAKFSGEPFRLALTIRRAQPLAAKPVYSVLAGLLSYEKMAANCAAAQPCDEALRKINVQIQSLSRFACSEEVQQSADFRLAIDRKWEALLKSIQRHLKNSRVKDSLQFLLDAGCALRTLFREV